MNRLANITTIVLTVAAIGAGFWVPVLMSNAPFLAGMQ